MTSAFDRLAAALTVWPLDDEQLSFVQKSTAGVGEKKAKALVALLSEAESAVISCANALRADAQSARRALNRRQPIREEARLVTRPAREMAAVGTPGVVNHGLLQVTADLVAAYVSKNTLPTTELAQLINAVYTSMTALDAEKALASPKPAVPIRKSVTPDYLICLEDGKKLKMLKRYLGTTYGMTPDEYRAKWGLPSDYPMVAPNYAEQRSLAAKRIGLGRSTRHRAAYRSRRGPPASGRA
jgi:predicted transcriptional regulator